VPCSIYEEEGGKSDINDAYRRKGIAGLETAKGKEAASGEKKKRACKKILASSATREGVIRGISPLEEPLSNNEKGKHRSRHLQRGRR